VRALSGHQYLRESRASPYSASDADLLRFRQDVHSGEGTPPAVCPYGMDILTLNT